MRQNSDDQDVSVICSVLNLTCMSMERFYAIVYPLKSRSVCTVSQVKMNILVSPDPKSSKPNNYPQIHVIWASEFER